MKTFTSSADLPLPAAAVLQQIANPDYVEFSHPPSHADKPSAKIICDDDAQFHYQIVSKTHPAQLPRLLQRAIGGQLTIIQDHVWELSGPPYTGRLTVRVLGVDGLIESELQLIDRGAGQCEYRAEISIHANIPLIGREIERFLHSRAGPQFDEAVKAIQAWLARREED